MNISRRLLSLLLAIALFLPVLPAASAEQAFFPCAAKLEAGTVLYADKDLTEPVGTLDRDAIVTLTEQRDGALRVRYRTGSGKAGAWIREEDAEILAAATPTDLLPLIPVEEPAEFLQETDPEPEAPGELIEGAEPEGEEPEEEGSTAAPEDPENPEPPEDPESAETPDEPETPEAQENPETQEDPESPKTPDDSEKGTAEEEDSAGGQDEGTVPEENSDNPDADTVNPDDADNILTDEGGEESIPAEVPAEPAEEEPSALNAVPDEPESGEEEAAEDNSGIDGFRGFGFGSLEEMEATPPEELPESAFREEPLSAAGTVYSMSEDGTLTTAAYRDDEGETAVLPEVRQQGTDGVCWAFATVGAMEIDLISRKMAEAVINLSEFFLAYFAAHNYPYPKGGDEGDSVSAVVSDELAAAGYTYLDIGGNSRIAMTILSALIGTTVEAENSNEYPTDNKGEAVPDSYEIAAQMTGAYYLDMSEQTRIQEEIRKHGSVKVSVCMPDSNHPERPVYYNSETAALYGTYSGTNHDVLLVGWNDDYSRENFSASLRPDSNGAWKARNSWGSSWGQGGYFWISYEDRSLSHPVVIEADNADISDYCYSYTKVPNPYTYYATAVSEAEVAQSFTVDSGEKLHAVGVETAGDGYSLYAEVRAGGTVVAKSGTQAAPYRGFYLLKLAPAYAVNKKTTLEVVVTYTKTDGSGAQVLYQYSGEYSPGEGAQLGYSYTTGMGSDGFTVNGAPVYGDSMIKLYTQQNNVTGLLKEITLNESEITLQTAETADLEVTAWEPSDATNKSVRWYSSDMAVAYIADDTQGRVVGGEKGGTAVITAMSSNGVYATCKVHVAARDVRITGISIPRYGQSFRIDEDTIPGAVPGEQLVLEAEVTPAYAPTDDLKWTTSNSSVLSIEGVDGRNKHCTLKFRKNGFATITVESKKNGVKYWIDFTVYLPVHVSDVALYSSSLALWEGDSRKLTAVVSPADAENKAVTWTSSNPAVASVDQDGNVTGLKDGTAYITVTSEDGGKTASCQVTVSTRDPVEAFVYRMYRVCLLREPDDGGKALWVDQLNTRKKSGSEVAYQFYNSVEMITRNLSDEDFVERCYEGMMGRGSDPDGKANWLKKLEYGMSRKVVISGFVRSEEFRRICESYQINQGIYSSDEYRDKNMGVTGFASRLYTKMLGRAYDIDGLNHWCKKILDNPTKQNLLNIALNGFMHSKEFMEKDLNDEEFVRVLYRTFLGREAEPGGLAHWIGKLESGMTRDQVAAGFANSGEFAGIMKSYGL